MFEYFFALNMFAHSLGNFCSLCTDVWMKEFLHVWISKVLKKSNCICFSSKWFIKKKKNQKHITVLFLFQNRFEIIVWGRTLSKYILSYIYIYIYFCISASLSQNILKKVYEVKVPWEETREEWSDLQSVDAVTENLYCSRSIKDTLCTLNVFVSIVVLNCWQAKLLKKSILIKKISPHFNVLYVTSVSIPANTTNFSSFQVVVLVIQLRWCLY